jgi:4-alpha-glucanotransferase
MKYKRTAGILLHPTSLPGPYGIGDLGPAAFRWVDFLASAGIRLWEVLPLGPTGYGDSPYQAFSAFAGNPYLISPEVLLREGWLEAGDLSLETAFPQEVVDYGRLIPWKLALLERAFQRFSAGMNRLSGEFERFCNDQADWLEDYALFMAIKDDLGGGAWNDWPAGIRQRDAQALKAARQEHAQAVRRHQFYQFVFFRQWGALRDYAHQKDVQIIGDVPIFVAYDSSDVWANPELFFLDREGRPTVVAGVPPDYFSPTGQRWGNPLYRWEVHRGTHYRWWLDRIQATLKTVDFLRIDHFRGFAGYWEIPAANPTAEIGRWVPGPGADFFAAVQAALGDLPIIAEDLGVITLDVVALRDQFSLPGMKILQFAFSGPDNPFLPHLYVPNCVAFTGTHDNDTARGWYASAPEEEREFACRYLQVDGSDFAWDLIRTCWASVAVFAMAPLQDLLDLGTEARMNYPSRLGGNWAWRFSDEALTEDLVTRIRDLNYLYLR